MKLVGGMNSGEMKSHHIFHLTPDCRRGCWVMVAEAARRRPIVVGVGTLTKMTKIRVIVKRNDVALLTDKFGNFGPPGADCLPGLSVPAHIEERYDTVEM